MFVICDTETNRLINPDKLWIIACKEIVTGKVHTFLNLHEDKSERIRFSSFASTVSVWIGHNFIGFDHNVILRLGEYQIDPRFENKDARPDRRWSLDDDRNPARRAVFSHRHV